MKFSDYKVMQSSRFLIQRLREKFLKQSLREFNYCLPQSILNIQDKTRSNIFTWRGQFSPQLIENLILAYCPKYANIFDPFVGSGTVLYESACFGLKSSGCEINPAAWILSRTYQIINLSSKQRAELVSSLTDKLTSYLSRPPLFNIDDITELETRELEAVIFNLNRDIKSNEKIILDALVILLDLGNHQLSIQHFYHTLDQLCTVIRNLPYSEQKISSFLCDARYLSIASDSVDFVITSPPYINVFNYHQNYRRSAEVLGWDLLKIAKSEIGSNRANRRNRFLTVTQYCLDIALVLKELQRVCKPQSRVIFVIGHESNVLGVPFSNTQIILEISRQSEMFTIMNHQSRIFKNKFGKLIVEDLLSLSTNDDTIYSISFTDLSEIARKVALNLFNFGIDIVAEKNKPALIEAIERIEITDNSPIYNYQAHFDYQK